MLCDKFQIHKKFKELDATLRRVNRETNRHSKVIDKLPVKEGDFLGSVQDSRKILLGKRKDANVKSKLVQHFGESSFIALSLYQPSSLRFIELGVYIACFFSIYILK